MIYPVLAIKNNLIFSYSNEDKLTTCSRPSYKKGFHKKLEIIDSNLNQFIVKEANVIKGVGPFWGLNWKYGRLYKVKLIVEKSKVILTVDDLKVKIFRCDRKNPNFLKIVVGYEEIISKVEKAETFEEIFTY